MATGGESPTAVVGADAVGQPTSARPVGVTGSTDSENSGTDAGSGAGSGEATGGAATDDPSWGGAVDGAGVRTAGGGGPGHGPHGPRLAAPVSPPGHATRETDRQGSHGAETSGSTLLDVA